MLLAIIALAMGWFARGWWFDLVGPRTGGRFNTWKSVIIVAMLCVTAIVITAIGGYHG